ANAIARNKAGLGAKSPPFGPPYNLRRLFGFRLARISAAARFQALAMLTAAPDDRSGLKNGRQERKMSDIFREVDEEVRRDQATEFWKKYQTYIISAVVVLLVATGAWRLYEWRRLQAAEAASAKFEDALALERAGKSGEADMAFAKLSTDAPTGYAVLARLSAAAALAKSDPQHAIAAYDALADDASLGALFREAARLRAAILRLDNGQADAARKALEGLAAPTGAFRNTARELLGAAALAAGDYDGAGRWLDMVAADPDAPQNARQNAELLLGLVRSGKPAGK
ncbi:MAG TPA: tetratricopeptide repeat protein, partial [Roseiarcus sp.]|nr:tetratricopeptide repeat protein [Roseiarcus sp.]